MRVTTIGSHAADVRELLRVGSNGVQHQVASPPPADESGDAADVKTRRIEMAPQISEYMVSIYRQKLDETGSKERAAEAVKNSDVFRSVLKRHDLDVVTTAVEASHLLDRIIRS